MKKAWKILAIIAAVIGAAVAIYFVVRKYLDNKKTLVGSDAENYVSCSCCDDEFVSETVA